MTTKIYRLLLLLAATTIAVVLGLIAGRHRNAALLDRELGFQPLAIGSVLPRTAVIDENGSGVDLYSILDARVPTVLIAFDAGCQSCTGQVEAWKRLSHVTGSRRVFRGLVCASEVTTLKQLRAIGTGDFDLWLCDRKLRLDLGMVVTPTIFEVEPISREIVFRAVGDSATEQLLDHLRTSGASGSSQRHVVP